MEKTKRKPSSPLFTSCLPRSPITKNLLDLEPPHTPPEEYQYLLNSNSNALAPHNNICAPWETKDTLREKRRENCTSFHTNNLIEQSDRNAQAPSSSYDSQPTAPLSRRSKIQSLATPRGGVQLTAAGNSLSRVEQRRSARAAPRSRLPLSMTRSPEDCELSPSMSTLLEEVRNSGSYETIRKKPVIYYHPEALPSSSKPYNSPESFEYSPLTPRSTRRNGRSCSDSVPGDIKLRRLIASYTVGNYVRNSPKSGSVSADPIPSSLYESFANQNRRRFAHMSEHSNLSLEFPPDSLDAIVRYPSGSIANDDLSLGRYSRVDKALALKRNQGVSTGLRFIPKV